MAQPMKIMFFRGAIAKMKRLAGDPFDVTCCGSCTSAASIEVPQNEATERGTGNKRNHPILQWDAQNCESVNEPIAQWTFHTDILFIY
jgi:hypothetical protein